VSYLKSVTRSNGDNPGSIMQVQIARAADVISIPDDVGGTIYGDIVFQEGTGFMSWDVVFETAGVNSTDKSTREGFSNINGLGFKLANDKPGLRAMLLVAANDRFIILFTDAMGRKKLFGTKEAPVSFTFTHDGGTEIQSGNFYPCKFKYEGPDNIFFYAGNVTAPVGEPPAIVKWKYSGETDDEARVIAALQPGQILIIESDFDFDDFHLLTITP
jgi:hypothetical protein